MFFRRNRKLWPDDTGGCRISRTSPACSLSETEYSACLNFGPCLAIGRLEIVATEIAAELGVDLPQLPLVLSAAQWLEEQALADGCFGLALGLPLHLGLPPFVTGSKTAVKVLTEDMKELTGGQVIINDDAKASADILEQII